MPDKSLYFIAIIPPEPFRSEARGLKEYFRDRFQSKASLNSPPHITLYSPFKLLKDEKKLVAALKEAAAPFLPCRVSLENFGAFPPRVIYINVLHQPLLDRLEQSIKRLVPEFAQPESKSKVYDERPFHPHMTLAFRDLTKEQFKPAWQEFNEKELSYSWEAEGFSLLRHNGRHWEEKQKIVPDKPADPARH